METADTGKKVVRIRRSTGGSLPQQDHVPEGEYRGFGTVRGETEDQFHDRMDCMFKIGHGLEASLYEMEVAFQKAGLAP